MPYEIAQYAGADDQRAVIIRRDISGGMNNRQDGTIIGNTQVETVINGDLSTPGKVRKRRGNDLIKDLGDNEAGTCIFGFEPNGGTNELLVTHGNKLEGSTNLTSFTTHDSGFTAGQTHMIKVWKSGGDGSAVMIQDGTNAPHEMIQDHTVTDLGTGTDDPPISLANLFFRGRWWILKDNELFFSDAYPSNYAGAFDQNTNAYYIPVGEERGLVGLRDGGIVCIGSDEIWAINPSSVPTPLDNVEKLLEIGCVANKTIKMVGDDVFFLAPDGVRGVFRTVQDKLQLTQSYPLSEPIKDEFDSLNWSQISNAAAIWWKNRYLIAVPVDSSNYNNEVWCYYPALNSWSVYQGWNVADWATMTVSGEKFLFYIDSAEDVVYRVLDEDQTNDETNAGVASAIAYTEIGRKEDMGQPLVKKIGDTVMVKAKRSGSSSLTVYASFDDGGWNELGTIDLTGNLITFPVTFPVDFGSAANIVFDKFPIWTYGSWYYMQLKIYHSHTDELEVLERTITAYLEEYKEDDYV